MIDVSEYDASYFDGRLQSVRHNAGYSTYERWYHDESNNFDLMSVDILNRYAVGNKSVLEICSAKGFLVEDLRNRGIEAYGVDVSQYCYDQASILVQPYLTVADIRIGQSTYLSDLKNKEHALIIGMNCLCCFTDAEITALVTEFNRVSSDQFYVISEGANPTFYNPKTIQEWRDGFSWAQGTVFIKTTSFNSAVNGGYEPIINLDFVVK